MDSYWPLSMVQGGEPRPYSGQTPVDFHLSPSAYPFPCRKSTPDELAVQANLNARLQGPWSQIPHSFGPEQQWRHGADGSIMELRKEKSRDAARSRRGKENYEFYELAKMLPLPGAITSQLDKASIIRLTISYLKLRDFTLHGDPPWHREPNSHKTMKNTRHRVNNNNMTVEMFEQHQGTHILQSLDGFAFNLAADGRFLYISETVSIYLGLSQVEMTGSSVFDYIHTEDHQELADQLCLTLSTGQPIPSPSSLGSEDNTNSNQGTMNPDVSAGMAVTDTSSFKGYERSFCIRMKSTLTKRGCHFKSSGYRVVLVLGHMRPQYVFSHTRNKNTPQLMGFVALAIALPPPSVHEVRLEPDMFVTRLGFDFRIAHCEPKIADLLDYTAEDFQGRSLYSLAHGQDVDKIKKSHMDLMKKGQVMSPYFRILNKRGGYTWMQICATIICNSKSGEEQNIICVNYVLSHCQFGNSIYDDSQLNPNLVDMKADDYPTTATPEVTGDLSRVESRSCRSPVGVSGVPQLAPRGSQSPPSSENLNLRGSPDAPAEGAPIKTEVPGALLTPMRSTEAVEENRITSDERSTPNERIPAPSASASPRSSIAPLVPSANIVNSPPTRADEGSVRELEAAMTRHLPDDVPDFSTDALLRGTPGHRSTIQWVGGQQSALPASTLLRQLYANRESVIRTSIPRSSYYPDGQGTLPTPPGPDGYQESIFPYNSPPTSSGGLMPPSYPDYHSAMTPPSSVSPREKMAESSNYLTEAAPAQPLPLKPQVYSYGPSSVALDGAPYAPALSDQPTSLYSPTGFHLYHSSAPKTAAGSYDPLRTGGPWYAPSS